MKATKVVLPEGHHWERVPEATASETLFQCKCGATFAHDMIDGSQVFEDGDGSCVKYYSVEAFK